MEEDSLNSMQRDYDKDPIVIVDRMPEISFFVMIAFFFNALIIVYVFVKFKESIDWKYMIIYGSFMYGMTFYFLKSRIKKHRNIVFYQNKVIREWDEKALVMGWNNISSVKKTFIDFYDIRQKALGVYKPIYFILLPISVLLQHPSLIVIKWLYKSFKGFSNKSLFDTIVIFDKDDEMITIFIPTIEIKKELKSYFTQKNYDIDDLSIFYTNMYSPDELTYYFNKKDK